MSRMALDQYIRDLIKEEVKNKLLLKSLLKQMLGQMQTISSQKITRSQVHYNGDGNINHNLEIRHIESDDAVSVERVISSFKEKFDHNGMILSYSKTKAGNIEVDAELNIIPKDGYTVTFHVYVKDKANKRIKPQRYVYHFSPMSNRNDIARNGILPKAWGQESSNWNLSADVAYPPTIFAVNDPNEKWRNGMDKWQIDTTGLSNKWWEDLNFSNRKELVMTFDPIPPSHIRRVG